MQNRDLMITDIEKERSEMLSSILRDKIVNAKGIISFADYMSTVLYFPRLGYYQQETLPMGKHGDFITAPELSPLFAACFAKECAAVFSQMGHAEVIEFGAGSGQFAIDFINAMKRGKHHIDRYIIIELSDSLKSQQRQRIQAALPHDADKFSWLDCVPDAFSGVVIANEVLDALPCHAFTITKGELFERGVVMKKDGFAFKETAVFSSGLQASLQALCKVVDFPDNYSSEINLHLLPFLKAMTKTMQRAVIFFIDYGYVQKEYYHPLRTKGTLSCFYQHHYHTDPFKIPGLQDITAHVDFTHLAECALEIGLSVRGYTSQAFFLLGAGLMEEAAKVDVLLSEVEQFQLHQAIKRLTFPMEMGETIKVMAITKGYDDETPLSGFRLKDRRGEL